MTLCPLKISVCTVNSIYSSLFTYSLCMHIVIERPDDIIISVSKACSLVCAFHYRHETETTQTLLMAATPTMMPTLLCWLWPAALYWAWG